MRPALSALLLLAACAPHPIHPDNDDILVSDHRAAGKVQIRGVVRRQNSEEPLAGARILIFMYTRPVELELVTDANGEFRARGFPAGEIGICVEHGPAWRTTGFRARRGQRVHVTLALPFQGDSLGSPPCYTLYKRR